MDFIQLTNTYLQHAFSQQIHSYISRPGTETAITGLTGSAKGYLLSSEYLNHPRPMLVIAQDDESSFQLAGDLKLFTHQDILHFSCKEVLPYEDIEPLIELTAERILVYQQLLAYKKRVNLQENPPIIVASIREFMDKVIPPTVFEQHQITLTMAEDYAMDDLALKLVNAGYERVPLVEQRGQFAIRGGILDIFNLTNIDPVRLEFYGNTLESLRYFRVSNQRSKEEIEKITIYPASESELIDMCVGDEIPLMPLTSYFPSNTLIVFDEAIQINENTKEFIKLYDERYEQSQLSKRSEAAPGKLIQTHAEICESVKPFSLLQFSFLQNPTPIIQDSNSYQSLDIPTRSIETYRGQFDLLVTHLQQWTQGNYTTIIVCDNDGQKDRFRELLKEHEIFPEELDTENSDLQFKDMDRQNRIQPGIYLAMGEISNGFVIADLKLAILTDREIFARYVRVRHYRRFREGVPIADIDEIKSGDYIVHIDHGIGRYLGLKQMTIDEKPGDFLVLEYDGGDKLYLPIQQINLIQRYVAKDDANPNLNHLGDKAWQKTKNKAKESIAKIAKELLELYGIRQMITGINYAKDGHFQREFESSFIYEETPDQLTAIEDVKTDMESAKPMDRLLCGDVGFGKTEVAIRAAFKAVMDRRQVAVLVPTTILAEQHWYTFSERLADYPVSVEMLSRFRSPKEIKRTIEGLKEGTVDIVIGTHRILSKDIQYKSLGLVIIDEEQRFGVTHKEKLKQLRKEVDVLTLTATPIPRTLYMSLSGIRDMSVINTPPEDRLPIQTFIHRFDDKVIREAILRELNRGGQVYFVHNRVQSIYAMADKIHEIVPHARIAVGHGQMDEKELEKVMLDFISKRYDILVSTTIIENGLDIPNCNSIIIDRADALGLSQLYQLRGRVGRDRHQAYAYLLVPSREGLTGIAAKRLRTLQEYTDLGSGYRIAMRDLEIRGMGNILGADQSGHMEAIGFDLYCKMVEQTIAELKGEPLPEPSETKIDIQYDAMIPDNYIPEERQKFTFYRKLAETTESEQVDDIMSAMADRYGPIPKEVKALLALIKVRNEANKMGIIFIKIDSDKIILQWKATIPALALQKLGLLKGVELRQRAIDKIVLYRTEPATKDPVSQLKVLINKLKSTT